MFRVKSVSKEGTYYLVNGWNKYNNFWFKDGNDERTHFKEVRTAKTSLTKLLKTMPEFEEDIITIERIEED